jgi:hypothetical protein
MLYENIFSLKSAEILLVAVLTIYWQDRKHQPVIDHKIALALSNLYLLGKRSSYELAKEIILTLKQASEDL